MTNYGAFAMDSLMTDQKPATVSFTHPAKLISTWFGAGLSPKAPGTMGSIAALPFAYAIHSMWGSDALLLASIIVFFIGWFAAHSYMKRMGATGDPQEIVIDEVAGQWFLLSFLYATWQSYLVGLLLFRLFDVVKPWPVSWADKKIKGALGVMLDDMLAAAYPLIILAIVVIAFTVMGYKLKYTLLITLLGGEVHV